jgi:hypothetical protein
MRTLKGCTQASKSTLLLAQQWSAVGIWWVKEGWKEGRKEGSNCTYHHLGDVYDHQLQRLHAMIQYAKDMD